MDARRLVGFKEWLGRKRAAGETAQTVRQQGLGLDGLPVDELAALVSLAASKEAFQLLTALELEQTEASERLPGVFFELLAFYQYLVLVYVANVTELDKSSLELFGGSLNLALARIPPREQGAYFIELLSSEVLKGLVAAYLAGDTSVSELTRDEWTRVLTFTSFDKLSGDFMAMNHVVLFCRLLRALGKSYGETSGAKLLILTWITHRDFARNQEILLREKFNRAFPGLLA